MMLKRLLKKYAGLPIQMRASFWFLICAFLQKGITSLTTPIFTRLMSPEEYGQFSVFNSWMSIITIFVTLNLFMGVYMQGMVKFSEDRKRCSSSLQGLVLALVILWTSVYLLFHRFWNRLFALTTVQMLAMLVMIWMSAAFSFWATEQRIELRYRKLVSVTLISTLAKPLVGIVFVLYADDKVTARILGLAIVEIVCYMGLFFSQMLRGKQFFSRRFWKYALCFNIPLIPHYLSMSVLSGADRIMIARMIGDTEAGFYNLAYSVSMIMTLFNTALMQTIEPWLYKKIKEKRLEDMRLLANMTFAIIAAVNVFLIALAPEVVMLFAPKTYYDAIWVIPPVAMSVYFMFAYNFFAVFEFYYEKTAYIALATVIGAVLNVVLNFIFIRLYGYYAAGYTTLFCYILYALFHYLSARRIWRSDLDGKQPYNLKMLLGMTGAFLLTGFLLLLLYRHTVVRFSLILVALTAIVVRRKTVADILKSLVNSRLEGKQE